MESTTSATEFADSIDQVRVDLQQRPLQKRLGLTGRIRRTALVVRGTADRILPPSTARAGANTDARVAIIESAGHLPQIETPEILQSLIDDFIATT